MPTTSHRSLIGRHDEINRLLVLVRAAEQGEGGVLVLRGEPGIGKSALLDHVEHARAVAEVDAFGNLIISVGPQ